MGGRRRLKGSGGVSRGVLGVCLFWDLVYLGNLLGVFVVVGVIFL